MIIDSNHGCVKISYFPFSDKTMSFIVWFDDIEDALNAHSKLIDVGITVSRLNTYTRAFTIEHLKVLGNVDINKQLPSIFTLEGGGIKVDYRESQMYLEFVGI